MSRIGKQQLTIPAGVQASLIIEKGLQIFKVKGPLGELSREFRPEINIEINGSEIKLTPKDEKIIFLKALWGTYASHIKNMIEGVTKGFTKVLIIEGIGFKAVVAGDKITFNLGFSHQIERQIPKGIKVVMEKSRMTITGFDKELVGSFAEKITALKKPEPYKGKGIKYEGQVIKLKQGKKTVS